MPEKPDVYGVYRGRVSNVLEFGCFVELQGFRKKAEGLVHTSNISKQRCQPYLLNRSHSVSVQGHRHRLKALLLLNSCSNTRQSHSPDLTHF